MPVGMSHPVVGYVTFCGLKAVGYTAAAPLISRMLGRDNVNPYAVGATRTLIGMAAGIVLYGMAGMVRAAAGPTVRYHFGPLSVVALILMRIAEWWLLIWLFYRQRPCSRGRDWLVVLLGILWSFILDVPATIGWLIVGGFYVC
jgi:hypothetical protein